MTPGEACARERCFQRASVAAAVDPSLRAVGRWCVATPHATCLRGDATCHMPHATRRTRHMQTHPVELMEVGPCRNDPCPQFGHLGVGGLRATAPRVAPKVQHLEAPGAGEAEAEAEGGVQGQILH